MAARKPPQDGRAWTPDKVRERIRTALLVNALEDHVLKRKKMAPSAVTAALGLLRKCIPDLQRQEMTGEGGGPLTVVFRDPTQTPDGYQRKPRA